MSDKDFNRYDSVLKEAHKLKHMSVNVGALRGGGNEEYLEMIAMVNEYGAHIRPKNSQWLTIPTKLAGNRSAREIEGLFIPHGKHFLAKTNAGGGLDIYFWLKKSVDIPERSYLRSAFDEHWRNTWAVQVEFDASKLLVGEMTADELYKDLGRVMTNDVQRAIAMAGPENAPATVSRKGKNNPLIDTGGLYRAISWVVSK